MINKKTARKRRDSKKTKKLNLRRRRTQRGGAAGRTRIGHTRGTILPRTIGPIQHIKTKGSVSKVVSGSPLLKTVLSFEAQKGLIGTQNRLFRPSPMMQSFGKPSSSVSDIAARFGGQAKQAPQ
jgi:hypothetical protein